MGFDEIDSTTASEIVCKKLQEAGADQTALHRVSFKKLGHHVFLIVDVEQNGRVVTSRDIQMASIEEVTVAAPRIAKALVENISMDQTQTVTNTVSSDTRIYRKKNKGMMRGGLGIGGTIGAGINAGGGLGIAPIWYEGEQFAVGGSVRLGLGQVGLFGGDIGARYFFSGTDFSPFVGGGVGASFLWATNGTSTGVNFGFMPYGELGLSFLRSQTVGLDISARADAPTFTLKTTSTTSMNYFVPVTVTAALKF